MTYKQAIHRTPQQGTSHSFRQGRGARASVLKFDKNLNLLWWGEPVDENSGVPSSTSKIVSTPTHLGVIPSGASYPFVYSKNTGAKDWGKTSAHGVWQDNGTDIFATADSKVYSYDTDGNQNWSSTPPAFSTIYNYGASGSYLYIQRYLVSLSAFRRNLYKYNESDGTVYATLTNSSALNDNGNIVADGTHIWVSGRYSLDRKHRLTKLNDDATMGTVWTYQPTGTVVSIGVRCCVAIDSGNAYITYGANGDDGYVQKVNSGGTADWTYDTGGLPNAIATDGTNIFVSFKRNNVWDGSNSTDYASIIKLDMSGNYVAHRDLGTTLFVSAADFAIDGDYIYLAPGWPFENF